MMSLRPSPEFAASAEATPAAGLEAAVPVPSMVGSAPAVEGTGRVWVRAEHLVPGDVVIPKYGKSYAVEAVYRRRAGMIQVRSTDGVCKIFCPPETLHLVQR